MITCIIIILFGTFKRGTEDWIMNNTFYDSLLLQKKQNKREVLVHRFWQLLSCNIYYYCLDIFYHTCNSFYKADIPDPLGELGRIWSMRASNRESCISVSSSSSTER